MKGAVKIEFILGVVVFAIIVLYVGNQIGTAFNSANMDARIDMLKSESVSVLNMILLDTDIGLSVSPNTLSTIKLQEWNDYSNENDGRCPGLDRFNLSGYRLAINDGTDEVLFCGFVGLSQIRTMTMREYIRENTNPIKYGTITLEMW
ncbi:MAG: hypothetical protein KJ697_00410 [Nanoarchaeota archaeon]|nr:hypothetical protein [Nanoarchaeota archaeon]